MKIGAFAKQNHTRIDTIRHYMDLGLMVPEKVGGQYDFDAICQSDFEEILYLKGIGFSLSEIHKLMLFRRIGKLTDYDKRLTYKKYFDNKRVAIEAEQQRLSEMYDALQAEISKLNAASDHKGFSMGVPMSSLEILACRRCHAQSAYSLKEGTIQNKEIYQGILECICGHTLEIESGILMGTSHYDGPEAGEYEDAFIDNYMVTTSLAYLQKLNQALGWTKRHVDFGVVADGIALELGTGHGFFMRHFIDAFPETALYIAVDHNVEVLRWIKTIIERHKPKCKVLYLCADFNALPLKTQSIDLLLDISGSSNYAFEHTDFLLDLVNDFTKPSTTLHGYYILFENFSKQSKISEANRELFKRTSVVSKLKQLGYHQIDSMTTQSVDEGGPLEDFFVKNEKVYTLIYHGKRSD